jgi:hypothetical protein
MEEIRVKSEEEFKRLCKRIDEEASAGADHLHLLNGLDEARKEYYLEMNESNTFWYLTFIAHQDTVLSHLCRLYDQYGGALSLGRFLLTVKANQNLFTEQAFKERLKGNPHVDTLAEGRGIDNAALDTEIASVTVSDGLVSKLMQVRNTRISHTGADEVRKDTPQVWLPVTDIEALLTRARTITARYSLAYGASMQIGIAGADDYKHTLGWVRKAITAHRVRIEEEIQRAAAV